MNMDFLKELYKKITKEATVIGAILITIGFLIICLDSSVLTISGKFLASIILILFGGIMLSTNYLTTELKDSFTFIQQSIKKSIKEMQSMNKYQTDILKETIDIKSSEKVKGFSSIEDQKTTETTL